MNLVLCDDHLILLDALGPALQSHGHEVLAAVMTPQEAVAAVTQHQPDVLLIDVYFPGDSGLRVVRQVAEASPRTRLVFLSGASDPELVRSAVDAGAVGFIRKGRDLSGILRALDRVMAGETVIDPDLLRAVVGHRESEEHNVRWLAKFLTDREKEVLAHIVAGENTEEMAQAMGIARSTARTHVQNVLAKLGVHSRLQAASAMFTGSAPGSFPAPREIPPER